jgi:hypothetical protein
VTAAPEEARFLRDDGRAAAIFEAIKSAMAGLAEVQARVTRSEIGFRRIHPFAAVWRPRQYLRGDRPPLVLSIYLRRRARSPVWKEIVEASPGRFTHHAELCSPGDVGPEIGKALAEAWREAG